MEEPHKINEADERPDQRAEDDAVHAHDLAKDDRGDDLHDDC
jgi:hypothetical protein